MVFSGQKHDAELVTDGLEFSIRTIGIKLFSILELSHEQVKPPLTQLVFVRYRENSQLGFGLAADLVALL